MNRRERRAQAADRRRAAKDLPPEYYDMAEAMGVAFDLWREHHPRARPKFALPPEGIAVIASLKQLAARMCKNQSASDVVELMEFVGKELTDGRNGPTVMMLAAVLERAGVEVERVSLADLELTAGGRVPN